MSNISIAYNHRDSEKIKIKKNKNQRESKGHWSNLAIVRLCRPLFNESNFKEELQGDKAWKDLKYRYLSGLYVYCTF